MKISNNTACRQERIIPFFTFNGNFLSVLYSRHFPDILNTTEKLMLKALNRFAYKDGECYPKQKTLASKIKRSTRQVQRILSSLQFKGFIEIEPPTLKSRHLYGRTNRYHFLWHPVYEMSSEMTHTIRPYTLLYNKKGQSTFDPVVFANKYKSQFPPAAIEETLRQVDEKLGKGVISNIWGYATAIMKRIGPNYNEAESIRESQRHKEELKALLPTFGFG